MFSGLQYHWHWPPSDLHIHWWPAAPLVTAEAGGPRDHGGWRPPPVDLGPDVTPRMVRAIRCRDQLGARPGRRQKEGQVQHRASLQTGESQCVAKTSEKRDLELWCDSLLWKLLQYLLIGSIMSCFQMRWYSPKTCVQKFAVTTGASWNLCQKFSCTVRFQNSSKEKY